MWRARPSGLAIPVTTKPSVSSLPLQPMFSRWFFNPSSHQGRARRSMPSQMHVYPRSITNDQNESDSFARPAVTWNSAGLFCPYHHFFKEVPAGSGISSGDMLQSCMHWLLEVFVQLARLQRLPIKCPSESTSHTETVGPRQVGKRWLWLVMICK